jgi:Uma2 family endonuclease
VTQTGFAPSTELALESLRIPAGAASSLDAFRAWAHSEAFPQRGRIDYLAGSIEIDLSLGDLQNHALPKGEIAAYVGQIVTAAPLGQVFVGCTALTSDVAGLYCEPDVLYVSFESLKAGRVRYRSSKSQLGHYDEVEGAADLAVEVVSDSSVAKDTRRLPLFYAQAGIRELWLVDARGKELKLDILHLHEGEYRPAPADAEGFRESRVLGRRLRLRREPWELPGLWAFFVDEA